MAQKYNPLLELGFQEISTSGGGGSGGGGNIAYPTNIVTDFMDGLSSISNQSVTWNTGNFINYLSGLPFYLDAPVSVVNFNVRIVVASSSDLARGYAAIYRFDETTTDDWNLVVKSTEFSFPAGVGGWFTVLTSTFAPVRLEPGTYCMVFTANADAAGMTFNYPGTSYSNKSGYSFPSAGFYTGFRQSLTYNYSTTPSIIGKGTGYVKSTSTFMQQMRVFCSLTNL